MTSLPSVVFFNITFVYAMNESEGLWDVQDNKENVWGRSVFVPSLLNQEMEWWVECVFPSLYRENASDNTK
jgi:hypothetical protein